MESTQAQRFAQLEARLRTLFLAAGAGDSTSYAAFLKALGDHLRGYFRKRLEGLPDEVEDLVQEVLLAIHNKRHTYDVDLPISAWIHAIAKYKYVDFLRRRHHEGGHVPLEDAPELFAHSELASNDARQDVGRLLMALPDNLRLPIQLTKLDGLSVREAAERCGMSESAVKVGVHRGLKKLSELLRVQHGN